MKAILENWRKSARLFERAYWSRAITQKYHCNFPGVYGRRFLVFPEISPYIIDIGENMSTIVS